MMFKHSQTAGSGWITNLEADIIKELRLLIIEYGIDLRHHLILSKDEKNVEGFFLYILEHPNQHYECLDELRRALKNKAFI